MTATQIKLVELAKVLVAKTDKNKIEWDSTLEQGTYRTTFPDHAVSISAKADEYGDGYSEYCMTVWNERGNLIGQLRTEASGPTAKEDRAIALHLDSLFTAAQSNALDSEHQIDDLLNQLAKV